MVLLKRASDPRGGEFLLLSCGSFRLLVCIESNLLSAPFCSLHDCLVIPCLGPYRRYIDKMNLGQERGQGPCGSSGSSEESPGGQEKKKNWDLNQKALVIFLAVRALWFSTWVTIKDPMSGWLLNLTRPHVWFIEVRCSLPPSRTRRRTC